MRQQLWAWILELPCQGLTGQLQQQVNPVVRHIMWSAMYSLPARAQHQQACLHAPPACMCPAGFWVPEGEEGGSSGSSGDGAEDSDDAEGQPGSSGEGDGEDMQAGPMGSEGGWWWRKEGGKVAKQALATLPCGITERREQECSGLQTQPQQLTTGMDCGGCDLAYGIQDVCCAVWATQQASLHQQLSSTVCCWLFTSNADDDPMEEDTDTAAAAAAAASKASKASQGGSKPGSKAKHRQPGSSKGGAAQNGAAAAAGAK